MKYSSSIGYVIGFLQKGFLYLEGPRSRVFITVFYWMIYCWIFLRLSRDFSYLIFFSVFLLLRKQRFHVNKKLIFIDLFLMHGDIFLQDFFNWLITYNTINILSCLVSVVVETQRRLSFRLLSSYEIHYRFG